MLKDIYELRSRLMVFAKTKRSAAVVNLLLNGKSYS